MVYDCGLDLPVAGTGIGVGLLEDVRNLVAPLLCDMTEFHFPQT